MENYLISTVEPAAFLLRRSAVYYMHTRTCKNMVVHIHGREIDNQVSLIPYPDNGNQVSYHVKKSASLQKSIVTRLHKCMCC